LLEKKSLQGRQSYNTETIAGRVRRQYKDNENFFKESTVFSRTNGRKTTHYIVSILSKPILSRQSTVLEWTLPLIFVF